MTTSEATQMRGRRMGSGPSALVGLCVTALLVGGMTTAAWADRKGGHHGHDPEAKLEKLTKELSLTNEQKEKIRPILQEKVKKFQELYGQMKEIREQYVQKIEAQLTKEQVEKYRKWREERHGKKEEYGEKHGKGHKKMGHDDDN